jgi:hypothetical protein
MSICRGGNSIMEYISREGFNPDEYSLAVHLHG